MDLVRENLNFERGLDSKKTLKTGSHSRSGAESILDDILKKIKKGHWNYTDGLEHKEILLSRILEYDSMIDRMLGYGILPEQIELSGYNIYFYPWNGAYFNHVLGEFILEKDAQLWVDFMKKYSVQENKSNFKISGVSSQGSYFNLEEMDKLLNERFGDDN